MHAADGLAGSQEGLSELCAFQRRRVRRQAWLILPISLACIVVVCASIFIEGIDVAFGPDTPVRLAILWLFAAVVLSPIVWSGLFRAKHFGVALTGDAIVVRSWWRTRRFPRAEISAAEPLPAEMQLRDGFFSGKGNGDDSFAVWIWPKDPTRDARQLGVTTGTWEATAAGARRINEWLGVDIDFADPSRDV